MPYNRVIINPSMFCKKSTRKPFKEKTSVISQSEGLIGIHFSNARLLFGGRYKARRRKWRYRVVLSCVKTINRPVRRVGAFSSLLLEAQERWFTSHESFNKLKISSPRRSLPSSKISAVGEMCSQTELEL